MSDTPIYDSISLDPVHRGRRVLQAGDRTVTAPVTPAVRRALDRWFYDHHADLAAALAPYGVHPNDLAAVPYRQVVYQDEVARRRGAVVQFGFDGSGS